MLFANQGVLENLDQRETREKMVFKGRRETKDCQDLLEIQGLLAMMGLLDPPANLEQKVQQGHQVHQVKKKSGTALVKICYFCLTGKLCPSFSGAKGSFGPTGAPGDEGPPGPPGNRGQVLL
jgi:hypothetical protein